jgi:hypothetical protein
MSPFAVADGRKVGALTRDEAIDALREYARLYGPDFTQAAFNPANARWQKRPDLIERYEAGRPDGRPWPSLNALKSTAPDESFSRLRELAGFKRNKPGGAASRRSTVPTDDEMPDRRVIVRAIRTPDAHADMLNRELRKATEREQTAKRLLAESRREVKRLRERKPERELVVRDRPVTRVVEKTKTKTVKVRDDRALKAAREQRDAWRADATSMSRARDTALREAERLRDRLADMAATLDEERAEAATSMSAAYDTSNRLTAAERRVEALTAELADVRAESIEAVERASALELVRAAERRVEAAELRAVKAERVAAEHGAAVTGELRTLTSHELAELRSSGPGGESVMTAALKGLATARRMNTPGKMSMALWDVARAALTWRDRL